ncbi:hypothetical protein Tco_0748730 [Tanacetum coccineum]|uniref:Uncharacterized protein n=1 Tax=Tanacetum coccineum TaxID=301880 RepID=A0ABQ4YWE5_9ASTR
MFLVLPILLPAPSTSRRADIPEADTPPRKRLLLTTPRPSCEVGESSAAAAARQPGPTMARTLIPMRPNLGVLQIGIKSQDYREPGQIIPSEDPYEEAARKLLEQAPHSPKYVPDPIELEDHIPVYIPEPKHPKDLVPAEDEAPTPPLPPFFLSPRIRPPRTRAAMTQMRATAPSTYHPLLSSGTLPLLPIPLPALSTSRRADILEADTSPRKRLLLTTLRPSCEVGESSAAAAVRQPGPTMTHRVGYSLIDTMETRFRDTERRMMTALVMVNMRVSYQVDVRSIESLEFYSRHHDAQKDRAAVRAKIEILIDGIEERERKGKREETVNKHENFSNGDKLEGERKCNSAKLESRQVALTVKSEEEQATKRSRLTRLTYNQSKVQQKRHEEANEEELPRWKVRAKLVASWLGDVSDDADNGTSATHSVEGDPVFATRLQSGSLLDKGTRLALNNRISEI